ncbi:hypothetical protein [Bradyrhizobium sp. WSM1417]|uniref:hypothetical protein n=1 Tax=Bradyrhizobium sp. WSM1417 TaxID=754500 RepID=UPI0012EB6869|nr:hypothetical protein [Bradyrhizobium sp. WSM1417]
MKDALHKGRKPRELKKVQRMSKRAAAPETIASRYLEVLRLRQRVLEADSSRAVRH